MKSILALWTPVILLALAAGIPAASAATVTLTPDSGLAGETIQVDDSGWLTDDTKTVSIVELATDVATLASVDGVFTGTFSVPDTSVGVYTVRVSDGTESVDAALTVAAEAIEIAVESDADGDGLADSLASPFSVLEYGSPASSLTFAVTGGSGGEYTLSFSNLPSLGGLVDPTTTFALVEGSVFSTTDGALTLEFVGVPQATASFFDSDSFIVRASDDSGNSAPVIVDLAITDVNQSVVISREPSVVAVANTTMTIPLVDFSDIDGDNESDPSVYDTDGDAIWFEAPLGVSALGASVSVTGGALTYYAREHTDISLGDALTDTVAIDVWDSDAGASATMTVTVDVYPAVEMGIAIESEGTFSQGVRVGYGGASDVDVDGELTSISDLTRELAPPEVPSAGFSFSIKNSPNHPDAALRDVRTPTVPAEANVWDLRIRTGSTDGLGTVLLWDAEEASLIVEELVALTGENHSAVITNTSTGEAWDIASYSNGSIALEDSQAYTFELAIAPSEAAHTFDVYLEDGWSLVSVPGEGDLTDLDALSNSAFVYDSGYVGLADVDPTTLPAVALGAFVNSFGGTASLALDLDSSHVRSVTADLVAGWNLIGAPSDIDVGGSFPTSVITASFTNQSAVYGYSPGSGYYAATELYPGNGYWVYNDTGDSVAVDLTQVRHLDVDGSSLFHPAPPTSALAWTAPLTMELGDGTTRRVELATGADAKIGYDRLDLLMPPSPPIADYSELYISAEDAAGRLMRSAQTAEPSGTEWVVSARVEDDHAVLRWQRPDVPAHWRLTIQSGETVVDMREELSMRLTRGAHEYRVALSWVAPTQTRLLPNYPNPFNPETWIPFELTEASDVAVRIYDSAGSLVRSFDLGRRAAGYYRSQAEAAHWDGRNAAGESVASGVYVYELRAGDYHAIRRMLVLK